ncbi:MAG: M23 family metallopeptidase [Bradymonadales bacterium]|nr:MAG: M23 family metallopeptidase [Bradymonadales bacterium]
MSLRLFLILFLGLSFVILWETSAVASSTAPWLRETSRALAPWLREGGDPSRKKRREDFFSALNQGPSGSDLKTEDLERALARPGSSQSEMEIDSLPWKRFEGEWNRPMQMPLTWPVNRGRITSGFGPRGKSFHEGIDIAGVEGQPIRAIHDGRVVFVGSIRGYGHTVVLYHGQGLSSVYAHNRENLVAESQIIQRGQVIATLGSSGHSTGPHLHFELRRDGKAFNPLTYEYRREDFTQAGL